MLIKQLLAGRKRSDFVIVKDSIEFNGLLVLKKFIEEGNYRNAPVHLIVNEYNLTNFNLSPNVIIHKYFPDPWKLLTINDDQMNFELLIDRILNESSHTNVPILIVIDSIVSILQYVDLHLLCNCLRKVTTTFIKEGIPAAQVVTIIHSELIPEDSKEFKYLNYIVNTEINLKQEPDGTSTMNVVHRQLNGKVQKESYCCSYSQKKELLLEIRKDPPKTKKEDEILVKTTFKLTLEEKEKESRSQVVLPYVKTSDRIGKGRIFYEPDVNDDWDDEDPDDDLEI